MESVLALLQYTFSCLLGHKHHRPSLILRFNAALSLQPYGLRSVHSLPTLNLLSYPNRFKARYSLQRAAALEAELSSASTSVLRSALATPQISLLENENLFVFRPFSFYEETLANVILLGWQINASALSHTAV